MYVNRDGMLLNSDVSSALQLLEDIKATISNADDAKLRSNTLQDVGLLISVLENPVFRSIINVQDSLNELSHQLTQHPSILPADFEITLSGELVLNVPPIGSPYEIDVYPLRRRDYDEQRVPSASISPTSPLSPNIPLSVISDKIVAQECSKTERTSFISDHDGISCNNFFRTPSLVCDKLKSEADIWTGSNWSQVEAIDLINDGTGLGFGIVGNKNMVVMVKTILPGGVADRDGRLKSGDHILQIGGVNLHEMGSEQVASVLRQSGTHVRLVVARPVDAHPVDFKSLPFSSIPVVPTSLLNDPIELDNYLVKRQYSPMFRRNAYKTFDAIDNHSQSKGSHYGIENLMQIPETEKFSVELKKDAKGLGITIAGYVCEKEELSGIFVKSINKGSVADTCAKIRVNDRIVEVDGLALHGYTNLQAVEVLRNCGSVVNLVLERFIHGPKYDQLQQAIALSEVMTPTTLPSPVATTSGVGTGEPFTHPVPQCLEALLSKNIGSISPKVTSENNSNSSGSTSDELVRTVPDGYESSHESPNEEELDTNNAEHSYESTQTDTTIRAEISDAELKAKWSNILLSDEIVVARLQKFANRGGLGISLEGTVDVEDGREVRPHHYIRSILPDGPVGVNGILRSGDELLEVNGQHLLGLNHHEVVSILKDLPLDVRMVCGRNESVWSDIRRRNNDSSNLQNTNSSSPTTTSEMDSITTIEKSPINFNNLKPTWERLVKAKSDGSLTNSVMAACTYGVSALSGGLGNESSASFDGTGDSAPRRVKMRSRSLEPLTGLAMWSPDPQVIELVKGERGLGFSILDYQDPLDATNTVIVIRSLVPGGVAQLDGRLIPGDRLLFVNDTNLECASLDQAVQALKGAPKGVVRIGVAKPLPIPESATYSSLVDVKDSCLSELDSNHSK